MKNEILNYLKTNISELDKFLDSQDISSILKIANEFNDDKFFGIAYVLYKYILKNTSEKYKIYSNLGMNRKISYNFQESIQNFQLAIKDNPKYLKAYFGLFETYAYSGDYFNAFKFQEWGFGDNLLFHPNLKESMEKRLDWSDPFVQIPLLNRFNQDFSKIKIPTDEKLKQLYKKILRKVKGKTIYVMGSQGLGDNIQCSRYIKNLLDLKPKEIIFSTRPEIYRVLYGLFDSPKIKVQMIRPLPEQYDYFIPIFSLIKLFEEDNTPKDSWINILPRDISYFRNIVNPTLGYNNIGIIWKGNPNHINDSKRSIDLLTFISKLKKDNCIYYSLQIGATSEEKEILRKNNILDLSPYIKDLYDTACIIKNLNSLITVDSAPLHLSGAIGSEVTAIIPKHFEDWRWGFDGETKWYNSLKLQRN